MKAIIKSNDDIIALSGATVQLSVKALQPYLTMSRGEKVVRRIATDALYDTVLVKYHDDTLSNAGNEKYLALLPYLQKPTVLLAVYDYLHEGHSQITDAGVTTNRDKAAFGWQVYEQKKSYIEKAYFALDELGRYLLNHANDFADWKASTAYTNLYEFVLNTPEKMQRWVNIRESYRMLVDLQPVMRDVEDDRVTELVTANIMTDYKKYLRGETTVESGADIKLLQTKLEPAVAYLTMADAIDGLHIEIGSDGAMVSSLVKTQQGGQVEAPAKAKALQERKRYYIEKAERYVEHLRQFLNANATAERYVAYYNSANYENPNPEPPPKPEDMAKKKSMNLIGRR